MKILLLSLAGLTMSFKLRRDPFAGVPVNVEKICLESGGQICGNEFHSCCQLFKCQSGSQ